jgi:5-(carboxyamino)imidazole ribonucleotide synthase
MSEQRFYNNFKLGVLGGGQLGRMLIQSCVNLDVFTSVLDPDSQAPCAGFSNEFKTGSLSDYETVYNFGKTVDLLTIEIENVNTKALKQLENEGLKVFPQSDVIEIIQDKRVQKKFFKDNRIPTAEFVLIDAKSEISQHKDFLPAFQKLGKGGYDGGGVTRISSLDDLDKAFDAPSLLEKAVDFEKEISVITARNSKGDIEVFPVVECVFHPAYNLVDYLISPADISQEIEQKAKEIAILVTEKLAIVGILAIEMFLTKDGEILVNECAPRPHNSGHQTIDANYTSQYEQHLRAILNLPLGSTKIRQASAMVNVLGEDGFAGNAIYQGIEEIMSIEGAKIYLYGKKITKPHRKMGHVTIVDTEISSLKKKVQIVKNSIKVIA